MKKYLAFYGATYYPSRGMGDFVGDYDTVDEAIEAIEKENQLKDDGEWILVWAVIWDSETRADIWEKF